MSSVNRLPGIGKDQWINYHYNGNFKRTSAKDNVEVSLQSSTTFSMSFSQACELAANQIYDFADGRPIYVAMSGGCDSETVADSFAKLKIPIIPVITDVHYFSFHANYADTWWAKMWCKQNNIQPVIKNFTTTDLIVNAYHLAEELNARHLYPLLYVNLAREVKKLGGVFVSGQGFFEYFPDHNLTYLHNLFKDTAIYNDEKELKQGWMLHECDTYIDIDDPGYHPYNFLSWNPEIVLAYINSHNPKLSTEENKFKIMNRQPRPKMQGPDIVVNQMLEHQMKLRKERGTSECGWIGTSDEIIKMLSR
jgi:hypothetical protein